MLPAQSLLAKHAASQMLAAAVASSTLVSAVRSEADWYASSLRFLASVPASTSAGTSALLHAEAAVKPTSQAGAKPPDNSKKLLVPEGISSLTAKHVGNYFKINRTKMPEAFSELHNMFYAPRSAKQQRRGGCIGLQAELAATGTGAVMYRQATHDLISSVMQAKPGSRTLVQGATGSGKSIALASLVEWARSSGWLVMYIPSASALTRGGYFLPRGDSGKYDTLTSAQHILKGMQEAHGKELSRMPCKLPDASSQPGSAGTKPGTLADLITSGLSTETNARLAVDCCVELMQELVAAASDNASHAGQVLFVVDDYNCLHGITDYGTTSSETGLREALRVEDLTLASACRLLLTGDLGAAKAVGATSASRGISPKTKVPLAAGCETITIQRYSKVEVAHALHHYFGCGTVPSVASLQQVVELHAFTCGNARELREVACKMSLVKIGVVMK